MTAALAWRPKPPHPVLFAVDYPERLSRLKTFFRLFLSIPQLIVVYVLQLLFGLLTMFAWFAILFTARYPRGIFELNVGLMRWSANVVAYVALLRDEYPPVSTDVGRYPLLLDIPYAARQSRFRLFVRIFTIFPNQLVFTFVQLAWFFTTVFAWFAILVRGSYPRGLFGFAVGVMRWYQRQQAYLYLLRDEYPPYALASEAPAGNEVVSGVIGLPLFAGYVALQFLPVFLSTGFVGTESDTVVVRAPLTSPALAEEAPSGEANRVRVTLLGYDDDVPRAGGDVPRFGHRFVAFDFLAEKDGFLPTFFTATLFEVEDCLRDTYPTPERISSGSEFEVFFTGGDNQGRVLFELPEGRRPCRLVYRSGLGKVEFVFSGRS
ncbi:MAG: DUF4389 domain-containing protein [Dehalococcoidia bacterium]|nr:DUF4389 domain-containing protein [Dehalococcoidia bacterium]